MAARHGRNAAITINGASLTAYSNAVDLSVDVDTADKSVFGNAYKSNEPGQYGGSLSIKGNYDPTASTGPAAVLTGCITNGTAVPCLYYPGGTASGQRLWTFNGIVTSYKESSPVGGLVTFEASIVADGAVTPSAI